MQRIFDGYARFFSSVDLDEYRALAGGQRPHSLVITCSDSRIVPEELFDARPGELFVLRNVGNLARLDEPSVAAALDYALLHLGVKNVVVLAHTDCGAVKASKNVDHLDTDGLKRWLGNEFFEGADSEEAGKAAGLRQLRRVEQYPLFKKMADEGSVSASLLFFHIDTCALEVYEDGVWSVPERLAVSK